MDIEQFRKALIDAGYESQAPAIVNSVRSSIRITTQLADTKELPIGTSRFGGAPDLPKGVRWPQTLTFIAQLNLTEIAPYDQEDVLPKSGWLYFFYDSESQPWGGDPSDRLGWQVLYHQGDISSLIRSKLVWSRDSVIESRMKFPLCHLSFANELTIPNWESSEIREAGIEWKDALDKYSKIERKFSPRSSNRMLGHPDTIQGEMRHYCVRGSMGIRDNAPSMRDEVRALMTDWRLLLQVTSDPNLKAIWGDVGNIYYWMRKQDLVDYQFANTWLVLQCS